MGVDVVEKTVSRQNPWTVGMNRPLHMGSSIVVLYIVRYRLTDLNILGSMHSLHRRYDVTRFNNFPSLSYKRRGKGLRTYRVLPRMKCCQTVTRSLLLYLFSLFSADSGDFLCFVESLCA